MSITKLLNLNKKCLKMQISIAESNYADMFSADGVVKVSGATVVQADVSASNGVIHVIDTVLTPPK